jgi:ATP-dependent DNA ligase
MKFDFQLCNEWEKSKHPRDAIAEPKFDGMMCLVEDGTLFNRRKRATFQFPEVYAAERMVLVGEVVVLKDGLSQFHLLQRRNVDNPKEIRLRSIMYPATLMVFDLLELDGQDLTGQPLSTRRGMLEELDRRKALGENVQTAGYWGCPLDKVEGYLDMMRHHEAEGIIVKDLRATYKPTRNDGWLKLKAWEQADYDILSHEFTEAGGFVVWIANKGYKQKVAVNRTDLQDSIAKGRTKRLTIRYLDEEESGALRQPHVRGVPWK